MSYRQEILKPFYDALVSLGFEKPKPTICIGMPDLEDPWKSWNYPKIQEIQYHQQITDDFIDVIAISIEGTDKIFGLSLSLAVIVLSLERPSAVLMEADLGFELGGSFTIMSDLITSREPMSFAESKRDADRLQVTELIDRIKGVAIPFFRSRTTIESLLPDLKATKKAEGLSGGSVFKAKFVTLPLALILLKRPEEAFDHLLSLEEMPGTIYENMSVKLKTMFPELM